MKRMILLPVFWVCMTAFALAQETTTTTQVAAMEDADSTVVDEPESQNLLERFPWLAYMPRIGGFVQGRYTSHINTGFVNNDQNRFSVPGVRLVVQDGDNLDTDFGQFKYKLQFDVPGGSLAMKDMWLEYAPWEQLRIRFGQFKVPFAYMNMLSSARKMFADSVQYDDALYGRDAGLQVHGRIVFVDDALALRYAGAVVNGEGANNFENVNEEFMFAERFVLDVLGGTGDTETDLLGCYVLYNDGTDTRCDNERPLRISLGASLAQSDDNLRGAIYEQNRVDRRWAVEAHLKYEGLAAHFEWMQGTMQAGGGNPEFDRLGYVAQLAYNPLWIPWAELAYRYEFFDYDTSANQFAYEFQARSAHTAGLNLYFWGHNAKLQLNYQLTNLEEAIATSPEGNPLIGDKFLVQAQVGF